MGDHNKHSTNSTHDPQPLFRNQPRNSMFYRWSVVYMFCGTKLSVIAPYVCSVHAPMSEWKLHGNVQLQRHRRQPVWHNSILLVDISRTMKQHISKIASCCTRPTIHNGTKKWWTSQLLQTN